MDENKAYWVPEIENVYHDLVCSAMTVNQIIRNWPKDEYCPFVSIRAKIDDAWLTIEEYYPFLKER